MNTEMNQVVVIKKDKKTKKVKPVPIVVEEPIVEEIVEEQIISNEDDIKVDDDDAELAEQERIIKEATERAEFLRMKKQLISRSGEFLEKLKVKLNIQKENLQKELEKIQEEVELLESINEETDDVMGFLSEHYADFVNEIAFPKTQKKNKNETGEKKKGTRTAIDRKAYPSMIPHNMVLQAAGFHKIDKARGKIVMKVIFNSKDKCFYDEDGKKYELLQDANRVWCNLRGYDKLGNAWEDFMALNLKTNKTRSIQNLHIENWIEDEGAEDYITE